MTTKAKPRTTTPRITNKRPISISAVVDAVGVLASLSTRGHVYLYDTNRTAGSTGFGTEQLRTKVKAGDTLLWSPLALECEAYVAIDGIEIDPAVAEPVRKVYPGTDVSYWTATVKSLPGEEVPYRIRYRVGTRTEPVTSDQSSFLIG
ncbi:hypothetical protein GCM10010329_40440 [Streptomyces spiroverticillatus]|uniref:Uncharacterized protein n=1 Tax=Streptomyces finlayi TaxID=67296 RepID=A0A919CBB2_9ACTN|nr:hypothetical protein [Streptomyces finlayi]GHA13518.1 hypothetical protein GCM10010329_40440 [Streptomyces spiroverticillatus]GHC97893.1 hypothetical protein GCM10010334_39800 [Streptomyces finlayi]